MGAIDEVIVAPLSPEELGARFRELCHDPRFANLPGKVELDVWGRMLMSPANNQHGVVQFAVGQRLAALGGRVQTEASILTPAGVFVADVAWYSAEFVCKHGTETPFLRAPEICVEIASPSNSRKELREKVVAYLAAGAVEVWIAYLASKRLQFFGPAGELAASAYPVDVSGLFPADDQTST
jgi:Uma2 family endonuclease